MEIFKIENLTYYYAQAEQPALKEINLSIREGEFILLLGRSGSGKSTLGRVFNKIVPEFYGGRISGRVTGSTEAGMVFQDPEKQLVMDKVERELAFPLENLGMDYDAMRKRVMETMSFLNIHGIKDRKTYELSGGQKQKVVVGSILAMCYRFLVLDEPTSQLDPAAAEEILHAVKRLNEELGYTILLIEQRVERCFHLADRVLFMEKGRLTFDGSPGEFAAIPGDSCESFLPPVSLLFSRFASMEMPLTVKEGRRQLEKLGREEALKLPELQKQEIETQVHKKVYKEETRREVVVVKDLDFSYGSGVRALKKVSLTLHEGELLAVMGENGGGKSTLLKNIAGLLKPTSGIVTVRGEVGYLSQDPNDYLFNDTLYEELKYTLDNKQIKDYARIEQVAAELEIDRYLEVNPRDLSGGEKQRAALASILVIVPKILILDEPTRGLDRELKAKLGGILSDYARKGNAVALVTHDVEFAAAYCTRVCLLFDGSIAQMGGKYRVLTSGMYYSTQMNRLFTGYRENILTVDDALRHFEALERKG